MSEAPYALKQRFEFGTTAVEILQGDILNPGVDVHFLVSTDDNYLTMGSGVAKCLREKAGRNYVKYAQSQCPVKAGSVAVTGPYLLTDHMPLHSLRHVLHGAVIDYDSEDLTLEQLVYRTTTSCLEEAQELIRRTPSNVGEVTRWSILFPAFATGSGGLAMDVCAYQMCNAIKAYLARERSLKRIYIILYDDPARTKVNKDFVTMANSILDVPFDPAEGLPRTRDIWPCKHELSQLREIIEAGPGNGKRHAMILGGPKSGKSTLADFLLEQAQERNYALVQGRTLVRVSFGRLHPDTPASFVYQKLLCALGNHEHSKELQRAIRAAYARLADCADFSDYGKIAAQSSDIFLSFLEHNNARCPSPVFLIDNLPVVLAMVSDDRKAREFWNSFDKLTARAQFICTARDDEDYGRLLDVMSDSFKAQMLVMRLKCIPVDQREAWINDQYQRYLGRNATYAEHGFIEAEAGQHPYLIDLVSSALIRVMKQDAIKFPVPHLEKPPRDSLERVFREARRTIDQPRRAFFAQLMTMPTGECLIDLRNLSRAVLRDDEYEQLRMESEQLTEGAKDPQLSRRLTELGTQKDMEDFRGNLHLESVEQLESWGYLSNIQTSEAKNDPRKTVQFMAKPFASYVQGFFRPSSPIGLTAEPKDLRISLFWNRPVAGRSTGPMGNCQGTPDGGASFLQTMLCSGGARILAAQRPFLPEIKHEFMADFNQLVNSRLHSTRSGTPSNFRDLKEVGNYILTQLTTVAIKQHLQELPFGSNVMLIIDDALKDIPWELMLETAYAGEIPFRVGRAVVTSQEPRPIRPAVRGSGKIKALLIADPSDNLHEAREEIDWLNETLERDGRFKPEILKGSAECTRIQLLNHLASGEYGLVHYSGHSCYAGERSAWQLKDGETITTDQLTNAMQMTPPALVFSSSCESGEASEAKPIEYEGQCFDLPSSFLQAGVDAYIGTLWNVFAEPARKFTQQFYSDFLSTEYNLGECMRRAKWAGKRGGQWRDRIHWLAFVLYGDPRTLPGDLWPALTR